MPAVTEELIQEMVRVIVAEVDPEQVYLFGSRARGDAREDSDVDLLVVEREPFGADKSRYAVAGRLWEALGRFRVPKDVLVFSAEEVARRRGGRNHVVAHALREGRVLYERP